MAIFQPVEPNDLDVHPNPPGLWGRVAVAGLWSDAKRTRKSWPDAAVVGPLRTMRGIPELVRSLLANPQIRVVILNGPDLRPDVTAALQKAFRLGRDPITGEETSITELPEFLLEGITTEDLRVFRGHPLFETICFVIRDVRVLTIEEWDVSGYGAAGNLAKHVEDQDRTGRRVVILPPKLPPRKVLPHGDPGQRVVGDTLADVWPRALEQAMCFGRKVETQHGETREVLALTSVVRLPEVGPMLWEDSLCACGGAADCALCGGVGFRIERRLERDPVLGLTYGDVSAYYRQLVGLDGPGERPYSYGSRMRGDQDGQPLIPNQIEAIQALLDKHPGSRAAYLTPWRPAEDSGVESGRPCLVGVWFRVVDGALNLVAAFRSHDLYEGYPLNLAGLSMWLVEEAKRLQVAVGTLTVHSYSAHVYERDYGAALKVIAENPAPMISWDARSSWRITTKPGPETTRLTCTHVMQRHVPGLCGEPAVGMLNHLGDPRCANHALPGPWSEDEVPQRGGGTHLLWRRRWPDGTPAIWIRPPPWSCAADIFEIVPVDLEFGSLGTTFASAEAARLYCDEIIEMRGARMAPLPRVPSLVAEALTPGEDGGDEIIATFEAPTPGALRLAIDRSGLVTSIGAALWLGAEIERVARAAERC